MTRLYSPSPFRRLDVMMLTIIDANRDALLSISGTRLWSGQNAQAFNSACHTTLADGPNE